MLREFTSLELLGAYLALDTHFWACSLDVLSQLTPRQVLELFDVADVTAKLRALIHLHMLLKLIYSLPLYL